MTVCAIVKIFGYLFDNVETFGESDAHPFMVILNFALFIAMVLYLTTCVSIHVAMHYE